MNLNFHCAKHAYEMCSSAVQIVKSVSVTSWRFHYGNMRLEFKKKGSNNKQCTLLGNSLNSMQNRLCRSSLMFCKCHASHAHYVFWNGKKSLLEIGIPQQWIWHVSRSGIKAALTFVIFVGLWFVGVWPKIKKMANDRQCKKATLRLNEPFLVIRAHLNLCICIRLCRIVNPCYLQAKQKASKQKRIRHRKKSAWKCEIESKKNKVAQQREMQTI